MSSKGSNNVFVEKKKRKGSSSDCLKRRVLQKEYHLVSPSFRSAFWSVFNTIYVSYEREIYIYIYIFYIICKYIHIYSF